MSVVLRRTSVYQVDLPGAGSPALDAALSRCPADVEVAGSGLGLGRAFVRVRVSGDRVAAAVASQLAHGADFRLRTGYGVNQRYVEVRPPVGCFCLAMAADLACLTCTCPDCAGIGRFGEPISHDPWCGRD